MKTNSIYISAFALLILFFSSCEDKKYQTYKANVPIYMSYDDLRKAVKVEESIPLKEPGKIYFKDNYIFINEYMKGIHIIDNRNPSSPLNIKFIEIPGNVAEANFAPAKICELVKPR